MININSLENKKIKEIVRLRKANIRKESGLFLIDGKREISAALEAGIKIEEIFYCPDFSPDDSGLLEGISYESQVVVSKSVFQKMAYKENPDGFLATAKSINTSLDKIKLSKNPLIVILESVEKPGNLGAIIRTAYAAGVDAIIINDNQTDIFNPNVIRASEGLIFNTQIASASIEATINWLKSNHIKSFAAATSASSDYLKSDMSGPTAIVLGSEANGLSDKWLKVVNKKILISMKKGIDSLNVSVSAAIIIFEAVRQRNIS